MQTWFTIINPISGGGKGVKLWEKLNKELNQAQIPTTHFFTEFKQHSTELCRDAIAKGFRRFIVIGGDGTYNEIANAVLGQNEVPSEEISLVFLPAGTGNDWVRTLVMPKQVSEIVSLIRKHKTKLVDVGEVTFYNGLEQGKRFFINIAGLGYDSFVLEKFLSKYKNVGPLSYVLSALRGIFQYKNVPIDIRINGKKIADKVFLFGAAIGKFYGSGMKLAPEASPFDGLFDVTIVKNVTKMQVIGLLRFLYNGKYMPHKKIETHRTSSVDISSEEKVYLQMDGELAGHTPIQILSKKSALQVVLP